MKYLIDKGDQSSHKEKDEAYYKDISGLLRDCILIYHSSTGQDYLQRPVYDPKCKDHYLWFLGISKFWDTSSTFIHITAHRIQTILRALFNIYLGEKYKTLDQLIKRSLGKNAQKRNIGLQILSSIADKDLGVFFEIIDMMGNIEQQDHNWKCNIDEIIDIFSIPPKRILLESSESFGSSRNSKIFLENYLQLASLIQEEKEIIISELVHLCHLISYIRSVASSIDKFNNISLALNKLIHIHEIIVGIDENTKQKIMQVLHEVKNELELSKLNLQTFQVDLEVVFPEAVYASPRKSVGKEGLPFETRIRILIKNQTSLYAPGVSLRLIDCSEYLAISYMGSTISDLEPLQEVVIEVECYIKNDSGNLRFDYQCTYLGSEKLQDFKATRVLPLSQWNEIPNLYELDAVQDHHKFMFTGRETILRDISRKVNRGGSVMTFGIRRIGKTSILYHLRRELRKLSDIYNIVVVYIDARPWRDEILLNAINNIEREICESIAAACGLGRNTGYENLVRFLNSIGSYLKGSNKKIVLILDEFDMILAHAASLQLPAHQDPWASFLSRLGSPSPDIRRCFSLVIAGHHRLGTDANYMTRYLWCLKDFLPVEVYLFSEEESREYFVNKVSQEFIRQHIDEIKEAVESNDKSLGSLVYSKSVISIIMRLTGNHPYYLSLLCRALIDIMNDKRQWVVTEQDLAEAIFQASMTDNHVMDLWNGSPFAPELFLQPHTLILEYLVKALRSDNDLVSTKYVSVPSKNLQMNSMIYNNTINELSKLYILEKDKDPEMHYRFKIDLIRIIIDRRILNR